MAKHPQEMRKYKKNLQSSAEYFLKVLTNFKDTTIKEGTGDALHCAIHYNTIIITL